VELNEIKLNERESRWPIKPGDRDAMVQRLVSIIRNPLSSTKEVTDASRALLAAERQNQADEAEAQDDFTTELIRLAGSFGIDVKAITDERTASEDPA
jgi:hypothetical protein